MVGASAEARTLGLKSIALVIVIDAIGAPRIENTVEISTSRPFACPMPRTDEDRWRVDIAPPVPRVTSRTRR